MRNPTLESRATILRPFHASSVREKVRAARSKALEKLPAMEFVLRSTQCLLTTSLSQLIELPDPLYAEINDYATRAATSPLGVVRQAWEEFRTRHPQETAGPLPAKPSKEELLAMVRSLTGSPSLPQDADYDKLRHEALLEKYGPL